VNAKKNESPAENGSKPSIDAVAQILQDQATEPLAQIVGAVDLHFWLMNVNPVELVYASPATRRAWGLSEGQTDLRAPRLHPEDLVAYADLFSAASGVAREAEYRVLEDDGSTRWRHSRVFPIRDAAGNVIRIAGVTQDITARKDAEQELAVHRALERLITTISADLANLSAPRMDEAFRAALADLASTTGADYAAIALVAGPDDIAHVRWQWSRPGLGSMVPPRLAEAAAADPNSGAGQGGVANPLVVGGLAREAAAAAAILGKGGVRSLVAAPLRANGEVFGVLGFASTDARKIWPAELARLAQIAADMFANTIERIRGENAMRAHLDQLAHVLRLGTMGQLASGMAHELNQPLAAIMNYVHACERRIDAGRIDADSLRTAVRAIGAQATRAADVIKALRALVKSESRREYEDLGTLVREALRLLDTEASQKEIRVRFDRERETMRVYVDVIQIQQVLLNLVQNACDAIDASGATTRAVYVATRAISLDNVEVSVRDTGPGVDRDKMEKVFEDFYSSKPHGLGLGLSISRSLIEAHGGRLWIDRDVTAGACFRFTLPFSTSDAARR
jgi:PAS domain S-box-containing protein